MKDDVCVMHVGVYGLCWRAGRLLVVRKTRGPYVGRWDLPGGGLERGEQPLKALGRELWEEASVRLTTARALGAGSGECRYLNAEGLWEHLLHVWVVYRVRVDGVVSGATKSEDTCEARWLRFAGYGDQELSPVARWALASLPSGRGSFE